MIEATLTEKDASGLQAFFLLNRAVSSAKNLQGTPRTAAMLMTVPDDLLYAGSVHPELRIIAPLKVHFERTEGGYAAVVHELDEYGLGDTRSEALEDLRKTLRELYVSLERDQARLSADLISVWACLKSHFARIHR